MAIDVGAVKNVAIRQYIEDDLFDGETDRSKSEWVIFDVCEALVQGGESVPSEWEVVHALSYCGGPGEWPDVPLLDICKEGLATLSDVRQTGHVFYKIWRGDAQGDEASDD